MELKKGMYVRFKDNKSIQYIGKLININEYREPCFKYAIEVNWYDDYIFIGNKDIVGEPSFDLINLIEPGDYVNGVEVEDINDKELMLADSHLWIDKEVANRLIETIITKEQFDSMKYVVERDK